jgi:hypothetical protein
LGFLTQSNEEENKSMSIKKMIVLGVLLIIGALALASCAGPAGPVGPQGPAGPAGPQGPAGVAPSASDLTCTQCHNDTNLITAKQDAWSQSGHGTGLVWFEDGSNQSCAPCHSGSGFAAAVAAGQTWSDYASASDITVPDPTPQDCRACHVIHTSYTNADFALRTSDPVTMVASGTTFDKGKGNLCVNCHQSRRSIAAADADGNIATNSHYGAHHGVQGDMLLGENGAGPVTGSPSPHYTTTSDACVTCHMGGDAAIHSFMPEVSACVTCHPDATNFDMKGTQTDVAAKMDELKTALTTAGLLDANGNAVAGSFPEAQVQALWNYLFIQDDGSMGVHNSTYTMDLLDFSLSVFK